MSTVNDTLIGNLWTWVNWVLNSTANPTPAAVIRSHQSGPAPAGAYVVVENHPNLTPFGSSSKAQDVASDKRSSVTDYQAKVTLWEVNGDGDLLRILGAAAEWQTSISMLAGYKIAGLKVGEVMHMPRLKGEAEWIEEFRVEVTFMVAVDLPEPLGWIETVELTNNIGEP